MKKNILWLALSFFSVIACAQSKAKILSKDHPVKSVDWGTKTSSFVDGFWEMATKELEKKFTKKLVDSIEKYASSMYYAGGFDYAPRDQVKMYLVAEFDNNFGGKFRGVRYVLMVPYEENKELWKRTNTRPNDFFLVFPKEAVVLEK